MNQRPPGLYLKPPHGELSFTGAKTSLAKAREFGFEGQAFTLCSGPFAYGELLLGEPEAVGVDDFDARFGEHRVSVKERERWWPEEGELHLYAYKEWQPYEKPQAIRVPPMVQTLMGPVEFIEAEGGVDMGQGVTINISNATPTGLPAAKGEDTLLKAMAGDGLAIAELEKGDGADHNENKEEAIKVWTAADATGHTESANTPKKKQQWASTANAFRKNCLGKIEGTPTAEQVKACEASAIRVANAAVKKEKAMKDMRSKQVQDELSLSDVQSIMWTALSPDAEAEKPYPRDVEVYDDYVTYQLDGQHYMRSYAIVDGKLQLGEAVEVEFIMRPKSIGGGAKTEGENPGKSEKIIGAIEAKPSALGPLRAQADKALEAVVGFWKAVTGTDTEPLALEGETGFKAFKAADGKAYVLTWTTNAFLDRDGEIFSTAAIEEYADRAWKEIKETGSKGQLDFWHAPGSEFADIVWAGAVGRFLIEMGTFNDGEVGQAFQKYFLECPEAQKELAPEGWKASHRYKFRPSDKADGVYEWFDKDRTSVLAAGRAANPYTSMEVITMLNDEQKDVLTKVGEATGVDLLGLVSKAESETKRLEDANVAHKGVGAAPPAEPPKADETADEQVEAIAKRVLALMGVEELGKMLLGFQGSLEKIASRLDEVEKGDLERIKEKESWRPSVPWFRASKAEGTILDDTKDKDLKGKEPTVPKAIERMTDRLLGQPPTTGGSAS